MCSAAHFKASLYFLTKALGQMREASGTLLAIHNFLQSFIDIRVPSGAFFLETGDNFLRQSRRSEKS